NIILNNYEFFKDEFDIVENEVLNNKTFKQRAKIKGLDEKRADIIPAGILILSEIINHFQITSMIISGYALREGIVIDTIQKNDENYNVQGLSNIRAESIKNLAESCRFDKEHCEHVSKLALQLFDQLSELHNFGNKEREYLDAASRLHDIGYHISHSQHHRHSMYIISNSELLGFNENEINIIANIARYHRKSHPKKNHNDFMELPAKSREIVEKLSAILRVADSFDRTHYKLVKKIKTDIKENEVKLTLQITNGIPEIELWSLERRKALFEEIFAKKIIVNNLEPST
ncbi:MAG: HD domain-containing protein, partial [Melioribacteraceae bacterium]